MKIGLIANSSWNVVNFRLDLLGILADQGYEIVVFAPEDKYASAVRQAGYSFVPLKKLRRKGTNPIKDLWLFLEIKNKLKKEELDLVLNYTIKPVIYGSLAARTNKIKSINTITGLGFSFLSRGFINKLVLQLYKHSLRFADRVYFQNQDDRMLFHNLNIISEDKTGIIPGSGIDTKKFKSQEDYPRREKLKFLFVGRLLYDKGIREYVEAAKLVLKNQEHEFLVVGALDPENPSGIKNIQLEEWVNNGTINYLGESNEVKNFIEDCDVVVLPSYREGLPRVLLEAMAMSRPIIATDTAGCRETVIEEENGYLAELKSAESLAQTMHKIIADGYVKRREMGIKGREMVLQKFEGKIVNKIYLKEIKKLLGAE